MDVKPRDEKVNIREVQASRRAQKLLLSKILVFVPRLDEASRLL